MFVDLNNIDLTGEDPGFKRSDMRYVVFQSGQVIDFKEPIFGGSIAVDKFDTATQTWVPLIVENDFIVPDLPSPYVDTDAISDAKLASIANNQPRFTANLVTAIIMNFDVTEDVQIAVRGQALYRRLTDYTEVDAGPDYTRAFGASLVKRINNLEQHSNPLSHITTTELGKINILEEDLTAQLAENFIQHEVHHVNVPNNIYVIRPMYGAFYDEGRDLKVEFSGTEEVTITDSHIGSTMVFRDEEVVLTAVNIETYRGTIQKIKKSAVTLVRGVDYAIRGIDRSRTRIALVPYGVYDTIILKKKLIGDALVTYHAFGGSVSMKDIYTLKDSILTVANNLENKRFVTASEVNTLPKIISIVNRLGRLEDMLHIYENIMIAYHHRFDAMTGSDDLWIDIGHLSHFGYTGENDVPSIYSETFNLINQTLDYKATFDLRYDLTVNQLTVENASVCCGKFDALGMEYFTRRRTPKFRILYDKNHLSKGLTLQMSIIAGVNEDNTWCIQQIHGNTAMWTVLDKDGGFHEERGTTSVLPDGSQWNPQIDGMVKTNIAVLSDPYTIFVGAITMKMLDQFSYREGEYFNNVADGTYGTAAAKKDEPCLVELDGMSLSSCFDKKAFDISNVKGLQFVIYDRYEGRYLVNKTNKVISEENSVRAGVTYYELDLCHIEAHITINEDVLGIKVKTHTGTNSLESNRFELRRIDVLFNEKEV